MVIASGTPGSGILITGAVTTGTYQPVVTGTHLPVATGTNQNDPNDQTNRGDGRQANTRSESLRKGGFAASGKISSTLEKPKPSKLHAVV
jgi:hypothetical protein